jgi:hypothetical protein
MVGRIKIEIKKSTGLVVALWNIIKNSDGSIVFFQFGIRDYLLFF